MSAPADSARALGLTMTTALVVGNTIGVGIFMLPASLAPYGMNAVPAWLITSVGSIFIAWVFAGLSRAFPDDDGPYAYTARAFGRGIASAPTRFSRPSAPGGIQLLTRTIGVIVGSMTRQKGGVAAGANANSKIHTMDTTGAMPYHTFALVQQLGNSFKSWIVGRVENVPNSLKIRLSRDRFS